MKTAIIYGRVSTNKQSAESIETQIAECKKWADENNCHIVDIYDDSGQSGRAYNVGNRTGFQQIIQDAKNGRMKYALIHKVDRFARSVADYFTQEKVLNEHGVEIVVVGMPILQNCDIITKSIYIAMAEQFSSNLSNEVTSKMRTFAHKNAYLGGKPPYGFDVVEIDGIKTLAVNIEQATCVKLIYTLYMQGNGRIRIPKLIAKQGFLNEKGEPFTPSHIGTILKNKKYNGWYTYGIRKNEKGKQRKNPDKNDVIEIPDVYPKIIDDELFNAVQNKFANQITYNNKKKRDYPFTGIMRCGICGRAFSGLTAPHTKKGKSYIYYRCVGKRVNDCKSIGVRGDIFEDYVAEKIKSYVFNDDFVKTLISKIEENLIGDIASFKNIKRKLEGELQQKNNQIKAAAKDKYKGDLDETLYREVIQELNEEKNVLEIKLSNIIQQINVNDKSTAIKEYVHWLRDNLENADADVKNVLLRQTVHSVVVNKDLINVYVYLTTPPTAEKRRYSSLPTEQHGTPLCHIGKIKIYTNNGMNLARFDISDIRNFNKKCKI